ncbi:MAG: hypothetical protein U0904_11525 [Candidatus Nanopelagicales bacterium]|nr:hypothetical protein [Candidatus Nanopelagicales bacterium]
MSAVEGEDWLRAKIIQRRTGQDFDGAYLDRLHELAGKEYDAQHGPGAAEAVRLGMQLMESGGGS